MLLKFNFNICYTLHKMLPLGILLSILHFLNIPELIPSCLNIRAFRDVIYAKEFWVMKNKRKRKELIEYIQSIWSPNKSSKKEKQTDFLSY